VERATFHRIPSMLVFWMSTLSVSQSMVLMFVCCIFSLLLDAPNLLAFLGSKSTQETTKENFSAALEDYVTSLKQAMAQEMLQDSVIAIHQEQGGHFKVYEAAIVATPNTNHACCNHLLKKMDDANSTWDRRYKQL
jgi:hypothetical protein